MARIVTNKYVSTNQITNRDFFDGINLASDSCMDMLDIARGRIIISNEPGHEAIFVLSQDGMRPIMVAQNPESEIPANIMNYLNAKISEFETRVINSGDTIYNTLITYISEICGTTESRLNEMSEFLENEVTEISNSVESRLTEISDLVENQLTEVSGAVSSRLSEFDDEMSDNFNEQNARIDALSSYTMNLKITDHFMLTEDEYFELSNEYGAKQLVLTNETSTYWLNGLKVGDVVYYNPDIYYCIYEDDGSHHEYPTPEIDGDGTMDITGVYNVEDDHVLVLENVNVIDDGHVIEILESESGGGSDEDVPTIDGNEMTITYDILPDEHAIVIDGVELGDDNHTIILIESEGGGDSEIDDNVFSVGSLDIEESSNSIVLNGNYSIENNTVTIN